MNKKILIIGFVMFLITVNSALATTLYNNTVHDSHINANWLSDPTENFGFEFTATESGTPTKISIYFENLNGNPKGVAGIYESNSGVPSSSLIANGTEDKILVANSYNTWTLENATELTKDHSYWVRFGRTTTLTTGYPSIRVNKNLAPTNKLYRSSTINSYPDTLWNNYDVVMEITAGILAVNNFTISAKDIYDNTSLNNFSVTLDGETYTTTNGIITTNLLVNDTNTYNINFFNINNNIGYYFNETFTNIDVQTDYTGYLTQAEINLNAKELITNNSLTGTFKINGTTQTNINNISLKAGTYNLSFINSSYYQKDYIYIVTPLENDTVTIQNVFNQLINVGVSSIGSGTKIQNFTLNSTGINYFNSTSTTTGQISLQTLKGRQYYLQLKSIDGYANNYGLNATINSTNSIYNQTFNLYTENSILFNIRKTLDSSFLKEYTAINLYGNHIDYAFNTTNGTLYVDGLLDDTYRLVISSENYTSVTLYATVINRSFQNIDGYMEANLNEITFRIKDSYGEFLENVSIGFTRLINGSTINIYSAVTDFAGVAVATLNPDVTYTITASKTGYNTFSGNVIPVLTSYSITVDATGASQFTSNLENTFYRTTLNYPDNSTTAYLSYQIVNDIGALEFYGLNTTYSGTNYFINTTGSVSGGTETANITNINTSLDNKLTVTYFYKTTDSNLIQWTENYLLVDIIPGEYSITGGLLDQIQDYDDGLKAFIGMIILLVGIVTITVITRRIIAGSITGIFLTGFLAYTGFLPMNLSIITIIIMILLFISDAVAGGGIN